MKQNKHSVTPKPIAVVHAQILRDAKSATFIVSVGINVSLFLAWMILLVERA